MHLCYVCGSHSTGKSTLLDLFENYLRSETHYTCERNPSPRTFIPQGRLYTKVDDLSQFHITFGILSKIISCREDFYLTDRFLIDNIAYSAYGDDITPELMRIQKSFLNYFTCTLEISVFYLPLEIPLEGDGVRPTDLEFREKIDLKLKELLQLYTPHYVTLTGNPQERLNKMVSHLKKKDII